MIRLLLDHSVPDVARDLATQGYEVLLTPPGLPDELPLQFARRQGATVVTFDRHFLDLHAKWNRVGRPHHGILFAGAEPFRRDAQAFVTALLRVLDRHTGYTLHNMLLQVEPV